MTAETDNPDEGIAIVGMALRFPGAGTVDEFWSNLVGGVDSISHFSADELEPSRLESAAVRASESYVRARGVIDDVDKFDAGFFRFTPKEAAGIDPQHRLFLEIAWAALENAGYDPATYPGAIGVWAGMDPNTYLWENILPHGEAVGDGGLFPVIFSNDKDYLATRVSYKLDLRGPSVSVQTACSTGLVVVHNAFHALLSYQCDMALAGVSSVSLPQKKGYLFQDGGIGSRDGTCRPFDADASGTVFSDGVGAVVLKRLADAIEDGDTIYAVVKGAAINNDGARKAGYTAPSVDGQAEAIAMAQALAGISPDTISYVEAHGTATPMGDPIEIAALTKAFRSGTSKRGFCAIGSVKGNIGHLDSAAGIASIIKTSLALHHRTIPPSLHYARPNPQIDFDESPFFVNAELTPWAPGGTPRRAGVSAFGIGGTNAHVVLEEAPALRVNQPSDDEQLIVVSARTAEGAATAATNLARHLRQNPDANLADVAFTLQDGRRAFDWRCAVAASDPSEAADALERAATSIRQQPADKVAFLFPGQGAQHVGMAAGLYDSEPVFRREFDACAEALRPQLGIDIRALVFAGEADREDADRQLAETSITQPVLFATEYALARLWMHWGITPAAMIGHSLGEYTAACLAGVFSRDDAAALVAARGRLMQEQPRGAMMAVRLSAADVEAELGDGVVVAGYNAPEITVVSGPEEAVRALQVRLEGRGAKCIPLATSHAFHSPMMDGALEPFLAVLRQTKFATPRLPWISCVTGDWITPDEAVSPEYWARQLRQPVRFSDGVRRLLEDPRQLLLEVGPGRALATLARQHRDANAAQRVVTSLDQDPRGDRASLLEVAGRIWTSGIAPDWVALRGGRRGRRVPLPTYPFERRRHWIDPPPVGEKPHRGPQAVEATSARNGAEAILAVAAPVAPEASKVEQRLRALLAAASGMPEADIDSALTFLELGFDSMLLTQVAASINRAFPGANVTLKQLVGELQTPGAVALHLAVLSPDRGTSAKQATPVPTVVAFRPPVAVPDMRPIYFGPSGQVFGSYHPSLTGSGKTLTVICPPLFSEQMRVHFALRHLAISLTRAGHDVLRFDYRGTGDSLGDLADTRVSDWIEDVTAAVAEGRRLSGASDVRLVGIRAGALIAGKALGPADAVRQFVFWDPVVSGSDYVDGLRRVQEAILHETPISSADRHDAAGEFAGYSLPDGLVRELDALDPGAYAGIPADKLFVVSTTAAEFPVRGAALVRQAFACEWEGIGGWENQLNARPVMEQLVTCLTKH